jgi:manganese-dependent inorganic pyrophosphatase
VPCRALVDAEPLTVRVDDLVADISEHIKDVQCRAAVAVDGARRPIGLVTRSDLVDSRPRRVLLADHAEHAQSAPGVEQAEIVELLDHHPRPDDLDRADRDGRRRAARAPGRAARGAARTP